MKPSSEEVVYLEDLPDDVIIEPGVFKPQKGVVLKIAGVPVGTCDVDVDDAGNATYSASFERDKITPELYDIMFGGDTDGLSMVVDYSNVFDTLSEEEQRAVDQGVRSSKAPYRLPGR